MVIKKSILVGLLILIFLTFVIAQVGDIESEKEIPKVTGTRNAIAVNEPLNVTTTPTGFIINNNKIEIYLTYKGEGILLNETTQLTKNTLNLKTDIQIIDDKTVRYNHTLSKTAKTDLIEFGYKFPKDCIFNLTTNILNCNSFIINFTEAKTIQNLNLNYSEKDDELSFKGSDLTFIDPVISGTGTPNLPLEGGSETIVKNSSGSLFVLYSKDPDTYVAISDDSGATWRDSADTLLDCDFDDGDDSGTIIVNSSDDIILACSYTNGNLVSIFSTNNGDAWSTEVLVLNVGGGGSPVIEPDIAIDINNNITICSGTDIFASGSSKGYISYSSNSSGSWNSQQIDSHVSGESTYCSVEVDSNGMFYIFFSHSSMSGIHYFNSSDGVNFGNLQDLGESDGGAYEGDVAVNPSNDELYFIIGDSSDWSNIFFYNSSNKLNWSLSSIPMLSGTLFNPNIVVANDGTIHVIADEGTEIIYSNSTDGGITWSSAIYLETTGISNPHLRGSMYPTFNRVDGVLEYVYENNSGIYFGNLSIGTLDVISPNINITFPLNNTNLSYNTLDINYTVSDEQVLSSCWYSNDTMGSNTTITCGINITTIIWSEGQHNVTIWANDTKNNVNSSKVTFFIDTIVPSINITSPLNNGIYKDQYSYNLTLNITSSDLGVGIISSYWYKLNNASINVTFTPNTTIISLIAGVNNLTVWLNDSLNNVNSSTITFNLTFTPKINNINISNSSTSYSRDYLTSLSDGLVYYLQFEEDIDNTVTVKDYSTFGYNATLIPTLNNRPTRAFYTFDNVATDDSGNALTLTARNITYNSSGKLSQAAQFNGSNSFLEHSSFGISTNSPQTISTWIYISNMSERNAISSYNGTSLISVETNGTIGVLLSGSIVANGRRQVYSMGNISINNWTHIIVALTGRSATNEARQAHELSIYINGALQTTTSNTLSADGNVSSIFLIGSNSSKFQTLPFYGLMDDFRVYNYILTQDEVDFIYNNKTGTTAEFNHSLNAEGVIGRSRRIYGAIGYMQVATSTTPSYLVFNNGTSFTYSIWVKPTNSMSTSPQGIMGRSMSHALELNRVSNNSVSFAIGVRTGTTSIRQTKTPYSTNQWHNLVGVYNSSNRYLYLHVDGVVDTIGVNTSATNFTSTGKNFDISTNSIIAGNIAQFNGYFDEVRIYNRSLSGVEAQNMYYATNPTFQEYANLTMNVTITDEDTPAGSLYYQWFVDGVSKLVGLAKSVFSYVFSLQNQKVKVIINDSSGYNVTQEWNITTTFINPSLSIIYPTNNSNFSSKDIDVNYSVSDNNLYLCWYTNNSGVTNTTITCGQNLTTQLWLEGLNNITIYVNDSVGNKNQSSITFRIDTIAPSINIINPSDSEEFSYNTSISLNYTYSDSGIGISSCWFNIDNSINTTLINCQNTTFNASDGSHNLNFFANDSLNNIQTIIKSFTISLDAPAITLNAPLNNTFFNTKEIYLNYTITDANGIDTVRIYHDTNGSFSLNETNTGITSGQKNFSTFNVSSDGLYKWNVWANDTTNQARFSSTNFTFRTDTIKPSITNIQLFTNPNSQTVRFNSTINDTNLFNCWYSIYNLTDVLEISNTTYSCYQNNTQFVVSSYATYQFYNYANDSAGNINVSSKNFTTFQSSGGGGSGGGGEQTTYTNETVIVVISGNLSWTMGNDKGGSKYELLMSKISNTKEKDIIYTNLGQESINLKNKCEDIIGDICQFVIIDKNEIILPPSSGLETKITFNINIDKDIEVGKYIFNIVSTDQNSAEGRLSVVVNYNKVNIILDGFKKLFINKTAIGSLKIYNWLIVFFFGILVFITSFLFTRKLEYGGLLSTTFSFMTALAILIIL